MEFYQSGTLRLSENNPCLYVCVLDLLYMYMYSWVYQGIKYRSVPITLIGHEVLVAIKRIY